MSFSPSAGIGAPSRTTGGRGVVHVPNAGRLTLHLKRKWWELIRSGEKKCELRVDSPRNRRLLMGRRYAELRLWLGYPPRTHRSKLLRFEQRGCVFTWCEHHDEPALCRRWVWVIQLGRRLE